MSTILNIKEHGRNEIEIERDKIKINHSTYNEHYISEKAVDIDIGLQPNFATSSTNIVITGKVKNRAGGFKVYSKEHRIVIADIYFERLMGKTNAEDIHLPPTEFIKQHFLSKIEIEKSLIIKALEPHLSSWNYSNANYKYKPVKPYKIIKKYGNLPPIAERINENDFAKEYMNEPIETEVIGTECVDTQT